MSMRSAITFSGKRKTPLVLQTEAAECGLACLAMVAGYHGYRTDLTTLRARYAISLKGTTLAGVVAIAEQMQFSSRPLRLEMDALGQLRLPAILHWDLNHFVVLTAITRRGVVILDPARGRRTLTLAEVSKHFTGVALELSPTEAFRPRVERRPITIRALIGRLPGLTGALGQLLVLAGALEVCAVVGPLVLQLILDHALVARDRPFLTVLGLGLLLLVALQAGIGLLRSWVALYVGTSLNLHMVNRLYAHLMRLPMTFFGRRHLGDIVSRFESLNTIRSMVTTSFIEVVLDGGMALVTGVMMFVYSWKLALVLITATVIYGMLRALRYRPMREMSEDQIVCSAKQQTNFLETLRGMQSVKLFNREVQRTTLYHNLAVDTFNAQIRVQKIRMFFGAANNALFGVAEVVVVWWGASLVLDGGFSVGMLFAFLSYKSQFKSRMTSLVDSAIDFRMLDLHTTRVADIALEAPERADPTSEPPASTSWTLELKDLGVRYAESEPFVIRHVNVSVREGESLAIVGPSGCGKTTLLRAVLGLLPSAEGEILVGGRPVDRLGIHAYRSVIGTVMQDDELFAGSIADNIAFFDPAPDLVLVEMCARLAAVHDDVLRMPMGFNSLIGDMGTTLSGGQRQRVLLARALYKQPKILLLDEATSHLDVAREHEVSDAIRQLNLTRVIVAHRPETIATADRVFSLENGEYVRPDVYLRGTLQHTSYASPIRSLTTVSAPQAPHLTHADHTPGLSSVRTFPLVVSNGAGQTRPDHAEPASSTPAHWPASAVAVAGGAAAGHRPSSEEPEREARLILHEAVHQPIETSSAIGALRPLVNADSSALASRHAGRVPEPSTVTSRPDTLANDW